MYFYLLGVLCSWSCSGCIRISQCVRYTGTSEGCVGACVDLWWISSVYWCQNWRWLHKVQ